MPEDGCAHPSHELDRLLAAALRMALAERNYGECDAVPEDDESEARDALALAARAYVRAIDPLPKYYRPTGWTLDEVDALRVQISELTEEVEWRRASIARNDEVIGVFVDYHINVHPLPEDVRKKVVAAMGGVPVEEVSD